MIAVWIIAVSFTLAGVLYSAPKYYKIFTCRSTTAGRVVASRSSLGTETKSARAKYEYYVDGIRYEADTGWTTFGIFSRAAEYKVKYNPNKPQVSFLSMSGIYLNAILGTVFWLAGIGTFLIGIFLSAAGF